MAQDPEKTFSLTYFWIPGRGLGFRARVGFKRVFEGIEDQGLAA